MLAAVDAAANFLNPPKPEEGLECGTCESTRRGVVDSRNYADPSVVGCAWDKLQLTVAYGALRPLKGKVSRRMIRYEVTQWCRKINRLCGLTLVPVATFTGDVEFHWHPTSSFAYMPCMSPAGKAYLDTSGLIATPTRPARRNGLRQRIYHEGGHAIGLTHALGCLLPNGQNSIMRGFGPGSPRYCPSGSARWLRRHYGR